MFRIQKREFKALSYTGVKFGFKRVQSTIKPFQSPNWDFKALSYTGVKNERKVTPIP